jgi:phage portal protein BeeE
MTWVTAPSTRSLLYSQIGIRLIDDFTGTSPAYPVAASLEYHDSTGAWRPTELEPTLTPSGVLSFPGLGRRADATASVTVKYRVLIRSDFYRPDYLRTADALEFDVHPYDNDNPPAVIPSLPTTVMLLPSAGYRHATHIRVVRGLTLDAGGTPIANVEVTEGPRERVLSDERGVFALPLRWPLLVGPVVLDAIDHRTGRSDQINLMLPGDLQQGHTFTLT